MPLPARVRALGLRPGFASRRRPQQDADGGTGPEFFRSCQRTLKESHARLARVRRAAYAVLASSAILAPILIATLTVARRNLHSGERLWLLAIALAALSALALIAATLYAVRCVSVRSRGAPSLPLSLRSQRVVRAQADLHREGELLLQAAQGNQQRAELGVGPLLLAQRSLAIATLTLVLAGVSVLVAAALCTPWAW